MAKRLQTEHANPSRYLQRLKSLSDQLAALAAANSRSYYVLNEPFCKDDDSEVDSVLSDGFQLVPDHKADYEGDILGENGLADPDLKQELTFMRECNSGRLGFDDLIATEFQPSSDPKLIYDTPLSEDHIRLVSEVYLPNLRIDLQGYDPEIKRKNHGDPASSEHRGVYLTYSAQGESEFVEEASAYADGPALRLLYRAAFLSGASYSCLKEYRNTDYAIFNEIDSIIASTGNLTTLFYEEVFPDLVRSNRKSLNDTQKLIRDLVYYINEKHRGIDARFYP